MRERKSKRGEKKNQKEERKKSKRGERKKIVAKFNNRCAIWKY